MITCVVHAQECSSSFVIDVAKRFNRQSNNFNRIVRNTLKQHTIDIKDVEVIHIPVIFSTREASRRTSRGNRLNISDFFCYFNPRSLDFDETILLQDTTIIGVILPSASSLRMQYVVKNVDLYRKQLAKKILEINPDVIFSIYNIPRRYWYIKNKELFVLAFKKDLENFKIYDVDFYIENEITEEDLFFITNRRVLVF